MGININDLEELVDGTLPKDGSPGYAGGMFDRGRREGRTYHWFLKIMNQIKDGQTTLVMSPDQDYVVMSKEHFDKIAAGDHVEIKSKEYGLG